MGGVSSGRVEFISKNGEDYARLSGKVSTDNNGGFIQIRRQLDGADPDADSGVRLTVRGNDQPYFIHFRTSGTRLPWQYYQAEFQASEEWREVTIPFQNFKASGGLLRKTLKPSSLRSIGVVAYGRNHIAEIEIKEIKLY